MMSAPRFSWMAMDFLGREAVRGAVDVALEGDAVVVDLALLSARREDLEAARVGQDRAVPVHEGVQAAHLGDQLVAGPQVEVVGVGQHQARAQFVQLRGVTALTVACVPTGAKTGVSSSPCGVWKTPARARPWRA